MDDYILFVEGAKGCPDFIILVQVPHCRNARGLVEAMKEGGLRRALGRYVKEIDVVQTMKKLHTPGRKHFVIQVYGEGLQDFTCYVQTPIGEKPEDALDLVEDGLVETSLVGYLGIWQKRILIRKASETQAGAFDGLIDGVKLT